MHPALATRRPTALLHRATRCALAASLAAVIGTAGATTTTLTIIDAFGTGEPAGSPSGLTPVGKSNQRFLGTAYGGTNADGVIYEVDLLGHRRILHVFADHDPVGYSPWGIAALADGSFVGSTEFGGPRGGGTVYRYTLDGQLTVLAPLGMDGTTAGFEFQARDGSLYGYKTTLNSNFESIGSLYRIDAAGNDELVHAFGVQPGDGEDPGAIVETDSGDLIGTSYYTTPVDSHHTEGPGTIYRITPSGDYSIMAAFPADNKLGAGPLGPLVDNHDGWFYGTTYGGGTLNGGVVFRANKAGTIQVLHDFPNESATDGSYPEGGLTLGSDGLFYGVTSEGGMKNKHGDGTLYRIDAAGHFELLYVFTCRTPCKPSSVLTETSPGHFVGTTSNGGPGKWGTVYTFEVN